MLTALTIAALALPVVTYSAGYLLGHRSGRRHRHVVELNEHALAQEPAGLAPNPAALARMQATDADFQKTARLLMPQLLYRAAPGRLVRYVAVTDPGTTHVALIAQALGDDQQRCALHCFPPHAGSYRTDEVPYDPQGAPGTWHWPPRD